MKTTTNTLERIFSSEVIIKHQLRVGKRNFNLLSYLKSDFLKKILLFGNESKSTLSIVKFNVHGTPINYSGGRICDIIELYYYYVSDIKPGEKILLVEAVKS